MLSLKSKKLFLKVFSIILIQIRFASIKRMHDEVGRKQTEDYQRRLQKLKEEEVNDLNKYLFEISLF